MSDKTFDELLPLITHENKRAFLLNYPKFRVAKHTCDAIGIDDSTFRLWRLRDKLFSHAFHALKKEIQADLIELHEKNIDEVAFDPKTKDQSRIFGSLVRLRAEAPEKYREKVEGTKVIGDITVKLAMPSYTEMLKAKEGKDVRQIGGPKLLERKKKKVSNLKGGSNALK